MLFPFLEAFERACLLHLNAGDFEAALDWLSKLRGRVQRKSLVEKIQDAEKRISASIHMTSHG